MCWHSGINHVASDSHPLAVDICLPCHRSQRSYSRLDRWIDNGGYMAYK